MHLLGEKRETAAFDALCILASDPERADLVLGDAITETLPKILISTFGGAVVGALIGRRFNGTTLPLASGAFACGLSSLLFVLLAERWRLFRPHHAGAATSLAMD